jgi:hypothetical protein
MAMSSTIASTLAAATSASAAAPIGGQHFVAVPAERGGQRLSHGRVVVDHQNPHATIVRGIHPGIRGITARPRSS